MRTPSALSDRCLARGCRARIPQGDGGLYARANRAGWARSYGGDRGTGFVCPDHRTAHWRPPSDRDSDGCSEQVMVRMPPEMHAAIKAHAAENDRTMAAEIRRAIRRYLAAPDSREVH